MPELIDVISSNFDYENFFSAKLTAPMTATDTDIFLDAIPTPSEGVLVIDWDVAASREVIFYNSKTASKVTCPSVANGRGFDDTTATTHLSGANVIMAPVRAWFRLAQQLATTSTAAWKPLGYTPDTIVDNGNRSYTMVFNSVDLTSFISPGMRLKGTPTTAKPTQCASLNGTTQYFNKTTPAGMSFTDDFCAGAWVKPNTYVYGSIISRYNGTSGWDLDMIATGQVQLVGRNAGAGNYSLVQTYQALMLNRWQHVAAQLDMSAFTASSTTSYIMIDGASVTVQVARAGTNPTALIQAGNLEVGSLNAGTSPFSGKLAQVFVSSAKITQANMQLLKNQGITSSDCSTYNIISAYSLSGASGATDINTTNANNLTAQGSATTTNTDSPFGLDGFNTPGTSEFGIVMSCTFSTNTTMVVQAPEGCTWPTLPTSSAISSMSYSTEKIPYGFPADNGRWAVIAAYTVQQTAKANTTFAQWYGSQMDVPVGSWKLKLYAPIYMPASATGAAARVALSTSTSTRSDLDLGGVCGNSSTGTSIYNFVSPEKDINLTAKTTYYVIGYTTAAGGTYGLDSDDQPDMIVAECQYV